MKLAHQQHLDEQNNLVIESSSLTTQENPDKFLTNQIEISKFNYLNKNATQTTQSVKCNEKDLLLTENDIKHFFKSLLSYIPNSVVRLEDLIKQKEDFLKRLDSRSFLYIRKAHELILDSKQFGLTLNSIKTQLQAQTNETIPLRILEKLLNVLLENYLVLSVGVVERVYIAHEFKQHWVILSCKNQKGVGTSSATSEADSDAENVEFDSPEETAPSTTHSSSGRRITRKSQTFENTQNDADLIAKKFKTVCLIPRPWRYIDGLLNRPVLKQMLETIILHLKSYPNSTFEQLGAHFSPILQPIMTLELIEMLERLKCVKKIVLKKETSCDLFSDFNNGSFRFDSQEDSRLEGDETFAYHCIQNSIFTIKKVFPD